MTDHADPSAILYTAAARILYLSTMSALTTATDAMCGRWRTSCPEQWLERIGDVTEAVHCRSIGLGQLEELRALGQAVDNALREADDSPGAVSDALRALDEWEGWATIRRARR